MPSFGDAPRLNKAPKSLDAPVDLVKPPKPSDDIWAPTFIQIKESQFKEVFGSSGFDWLSGGSGNDDLANNPSGGGGNPDVSKMSFIQKLKAAIQLVPGLLVGDAKAAFQKLVNDPQFLAALIAVGLAFAALQAIPGVGQAIDAMLLILFGASAAVSLGNFLLKTWQAKNEQELSAAANEFKTFVEAVGVLALTAGLKLAGRLLRSIRTGSSLPSPPPLRFGSSDLVYGPSAAGRLRQLQQRAGGKTLTDAVSDLGGKTWIQASIDTMEEALRNGHKIHFDLTNVEDIHGILNNTGRFANTVTAQELRYLRQNWSRAEVKNSVKFYVNDVEVSPPW
ncbi:hypothetical protein IQ252_25700 [Tychonema sp. LEGE 07203]|nr:hypothetical protein [Tychonema sp. LEGE 07203]